MPDLSIRQLARSLVLLVVCVGMSVGVGVGGGCSRSEPYPQTTADEVLDSAVAMVENGDARRLPDLVYADSPAMRRTLDRLGRLLARLERTSAVLGEAFPKEIEQASSGGLAGVFDVGSIGRARDPGGEFYKKLAGLLGDPYAFLRGQREKLSTVWLSEETSAVLYEDKPVFPPFGLAMRRAPESSAQDNPNEPGSWYVVAPLSLPVVSRFTPKTDEQWLIVSYLFKAWENALVDLERKVESGELRTLEQTATEMGRLVAPPTIAILIAYQSSLKEDD